jgi:hypothetical protein
MMGQSKPKARISKVGKRAKSDKQRKSATRDKTCNPADIELSEEALNKVAGGGGTIDVHLKAR